MLFEQIVSPRCKRGLVGCLVVYKHATKWKGHIGFLYGKTNKGAYILLGGNQDDTVKFDTYTNKCSKNSKKKLVGFYIPEDYEISDKDNLTNDDIYMEINPDPYKNGRIINEKFGINVKSKGDTTKIFLENETDLC